MTYTSQNNFFFLFSSLKILKIFIYLAERDIERENTSRASGRGKTGFPRSRKPDLGHDPRVLGSELKAGAQQLSHTGALMLGFFNAMFNSHNTRKKTNILI